MAPAKHNISNIESVGDETSRHAWPMSRHQRPRGNGRWQPARWGGDQAEAYTEVAAEFRTGDRLQFTRNNRAAARNNGDTAEVVAIDADQRRVTVAKQDGTRQTLDMNRLADRHVRHGWVRTIHSSQGATCDHVIAHLESFRANTVDAASVYVAISRVQKGAAIYTDSGAKLTEALGLRDGAQVGAINEAIGQKQEPGIIIT